MKNKLKTDFTEAEKIFFSAPQRLCGGKIK
jgi:hypothetical protein